MYWSAEEFVLVITGLLFLAVVASSFLPRVELTLMSRATFAIGAAAFLGAAALLAGMEEVQYPPFLWLAPVVPLIVIGVLVRDALVASRGAGSAPPPPQGPGTAQVRRSPAFAPPTAATGAPLAAAKALQARAEDPRSSADELARIAYSQPHLRPSVAANPATPSNILEWLASMGDPAVSSAIAARAPVSVPAAP